MSRYAYKVLGHDRVPHHGGTGRWAQRKRWMPVIGNIEPCVRGYHLCADEVQLLEWLGPTIWIAEYEGDAIDYRDKIVVGRARLIEQITAWDDRSARHFAADCAEHVAHLNDDPRVMAAIQSARDYADGKIGWEELSAARDAAWAARDAAEAAEAARDAAWAAWAAADAADAAEAAGAAWAAAWAAWAAAWAASDAAWAEREWQAERLRELTGGLPS